MESENYVDAWRRIGEDYARRSMKPNTGIMVLYCTFAKDCEDIGLQAPPFTQYIMRPDWYEAWYLKALEAAVNLDKAPEWLAESMGWNDDGA